MHIHSVAKFCQIPLYIELISSPMDRVWKVLFLYLLTKLLMLSLFIFASLVQNVSWVLDISPPWPSAPPVASGRKAPARVNGGGEELLAAPGIGLVTGKVQHLS